MCTCTCTLHTYTRANWGSSHILYILPHYILVDRNHWYQRTEAIITHTCTRIYKYACCLNTTCSGGSIPSCTSSEDPITHLYTFNIHQSWISWTLTNPYIHMPGYNVLGHICTVHPHPQLRVRTFALTFSKDAGLTREKHIKKTSCTREREGEKKVNVTSGNEYRLESHAHTNHKTCSLVTIHSSIHWVFTVWG